MKLHPIFGINALARVCICCGKVIGYTPLGNSVEEDASKSKQIAEAIVCKECIDNYITATYDTLWIRNKGLKEFFKELDSIQPINIMPKEHFYTVFGNVVKDFYNNQENENN